MARIPFIQARRRLWLSLILTLGLLVWFRKARSGHSTWNVVDFRIKDYKSEDDPYSDSDHADAHPRHQKSPYLQSDYRAEIEAIRNRPAFQQQQVSYDKLQDRIQQFIQWERPSTDHWPAWHDYDNADYDGKALTGKLAVLERHCPDTSRRHDFFVNNTAQELEAQGTVAKTYLPYPDYNSKAWKHIWHGDYVACKGPRGEEYGEDAIEDFLMKAYAILSGKLPNATIGSTSVLKLDENVCFDRQSRYGPYGLDAASSRFNWEKVNWFSLQDQCFRRNIQRFVPDARISSSVRSQRHITQTSDPLDEHPRRLRSGTSGKRYKERTAILIRTWEGYDYKENDIQAIRALITETSLLSGGEYQVFLFVNIKQRDANIYEDESVYQDLLKRTVPKELRDISILWTEKVLEEWYPHVGDWQVYWMQFMPLQWFSKLHPEFDYIWNWETDARYIGNHHHFLEQISQFAKDMPRKHLWERNSRFFFPESWDGRYDAFLADTDQQILNASAMGLIDEPVWGPRPYAPFQYPLGPLPPHDAEDDDFEWGVGEEADLITLQPIWDPAETDWSYRSKIWNFIPQVRPVFTPDNGYADGFDHPGFPTIPRRVFINTVVRFSKKLLHVMHLENLQGRAMQAEMWPATVALHHGLKAVYAPHPIWTDRKWPAWYAEAVFNADDGIVGRWMSQLDSPYNHDREANFGGWSWYFRSVFPHVLYRKWLGWPAKDWGWDASSARQTELEQKIDVVLKLGKNIDEIDDLRMCLPGILLHPVKNVYEGADGG